METKWHFDHAAINEKAWSLLQHTESSITGSYVCPYMAAQDIDKHGCLKERTYSYIVGTADKVC